MSQKTPFSPPTEIDRLRYGQGQMLLSRDFRDQAANDAQLRWWHNRALHDAFGVAGGLDTALDGAAEAVRVQPGLAYDAFGREILLRAARAVPLPATTASMTLVISYRETPGGEPALLWKPTDALRVRDGVPLVRLPVQSATTLDALPASLTLTGPIAEQVTYDPVARRLAFRGVMSAAQRDTLRALSADSAYQAAVDALFAASRELRRSFTPVASRPIARPLLGNGATVPDATPWEVWTFSPGNSDQVVPIGIQVTVDTSAAGFTQEPAYLAWLQTGSADWLAPRGTAASSNALLAFLLAGAFQYVMETSISQFIFRLFMPLLPHQEIGGFRRARLAATRFERADNGLFDAIRALQLSVAWLGIQAETKEGTDGDSR